MTKTAGTARIHTAEALPVGDPEIFIVVRDGGWNAKELAYYSIAGMSPDLGGELISRGWQPVGPWEQIEPGVWHVDVEQA